MTSSKTPREFFVAETLKGDLFIFRENHESGGLTKFVEYSAYQALEKELSEAKAIIQRQAELISYLTKDKDIAEIKASFDAENTENK